MPAALASPNCSPACRFADCHGGHAARNAPRYFEDALFSATTFAPQDAVARGFVHEIVAPEALLDRTIATAGALAALPAEDFALTKRQTRPRLSSGAPTSPTLRSNRSGPRRRRSRASAITSRARCGNADAVPLGMDVP